MTQAELEREFWRAVEVVWGPRGLALTRGHVKFVVAEPSGGAYASVTSHGLTQTIGRHLLSHGGYTVKFSPRLLELEDADRVRGVMLHEAIHFGVQNHGAQFRSIAREVGAPISETALDKKPLVEIKDGARYKPLREFDDFDDAVRWAKRESRDPNSPYFRAKLRVTGRAERLVGDLLMLRAALTS